jgi:hypothetical protein
MEIRPAILRAGFEAAVQICPRVTWAFQANPFDGIGEPGLRKPPRGDDVTRLREKISVSKCVARSIELPQDRGRANSNVGNLLVTPENASLVVLDPVDGRPYLR